MDNEKEIEESLNTEEEETSKNDEEQEEEKDFKTLYENQKIRAEKAEKALKTKDVPKVEKQTPKTKQTGNESDEDKEPNYSIKDIRSLNKIEDDDLDDFLEISKKFGLSPSEAKENKDVQAILSNRTELRKTKEATSTGSQKRGSNETSGKKLLDNAQVNNKVPEDDKSIAELTKARLFRNRT